MKKEYSKPNMEIVSFNVENIATGVSSPINTLTEAQTKIRTIEHY